MTFKPAYWHIIYISALVLLGFQYYSKSSLLERTVESLGSINQQLQMVLHISNQRLIQLVKK